MIDFVNYPPKNRGDIVLTPTARAVLLNPRLGLPDVVAYTPNGPAMNRHDLLIAYGESIGHSAVAAMFHGGPIEEDRALNVIGGLDVLGILPTEFDHFFQVGLRDGVRREVTARSQPV